MLLEKSREIALGAKAEIFGNAAYLVLVLAEAADRCFHAQRIDVDARADAGAIAKKMIEVRSGQAGHPGDVIEIDSFGRAVPDMPQRPSDAIIPRPAQLS